MGIFKKMKDALTGGAATVTIRPEMSFAYTGSSLVVHVMVTATGDVKSKGIFLDIRGRETVTYRDENRHERRDHHTTFEQSTPIAGEMTLAGGESCEASGEIRIPADVQGSYRGRQASHEWEIRGRLDTFGNDPDSGWQPITVSLAPPM